MPMVHCERPESARLKGLWLRSLPSGTDGRSRSPVCPAVQAALAHAGLSECGRHDDTARAGTRRQSDRRDGSGGVIAYVAIQQLISRAGGRLLCRHCDRAIDGPARSDRPPRPPRMASTARAGHSGVTVTAPVSATSRLSPRTSAGPQIGRFPSQRQHRRLQTPAW